MRKRQTFMLTILTPENGVSSFCGRLKVISSGKTFNFTNLEELQSLILLEMEPGEESELIFQTEPIHEPEGSAQGSDRKIPRSTP